MLTISSLLSFIRGSNMRRRIAIPLLIASIGLAVGAAVGTSAKSQKPVEQVDATALNVSFTKIREVFIELGDDPSSGFGTNSGNFTTTAFSGARHSLNTTSGTTATISVTLGDTTSKKWHAVFVEYSFTFSYSAWSDTVLNFTYSLSTYRDQAQGEADHVMEFIYEGYASSTSNSYVLNCGKNDYQTTTVPNTGLLGGPMADRVGLRTSGRVNSGSKSFSRTLNHQVNSSGSYTFYVAFFSYIESSSYSHSHEATGSLSLSIADNPYDASYTTTSSGTSGYGAFTSVWNTVNSDSTGGSITLLKDVTVNQGYAANKNVTLRTNGYSLTRADGSERWSSIFGVTTGHSLVITNENKSGGGYVQGNNGVCIVTVEGTGSLTVCDGAKIKNTYTVSGGGHGVVVNSNGGVFNLFSASVICADTATSTTNSCVLLRAGTTFNMAGGVLNGGSYSIRNDNNATPKASVNLGGTCTIQRKIGINSLSYGQLQFFYNNSTEYMANSSSALTIEFGTMPSINTAFANCLSGQGLNIANKLSISGAPDYTKVTYSSNKLYYSYRQYTINHNLTGISSSNASTTGNHGYDWTTTLSVTGDNTLSALPSTIRITRSTTTLTAGTDYTYNSSTGVVRIYAASFVGTYSLTLTASAVRTDKGKAYDFIDEKMHMDDYTEELGYCKDNTHKYYAYAKVAFNQLDVSVREVFKTSSDQKIVDARARLEAWARANGEEFQYDASTGYTLGTSINNNDNDLNSNNGNNNMIIIICAIAAISATSLLVLTILKKKNRK